MKKNKLLISIFIIVAMFLSYASITTVAVSAASNTYEARYAQLSGEARVVSDINGTYVGFVSNNSATRFTVYSASTTTSASIKIYYCTGESRSANLYINGYLIQRISFPITGWYNFSYYKVNNVCLNSGYNTIEIRGGSTYWAPDFQKIVVDTPSSGVTYKAINAQLSGGAKIVNDSNGAYVGFVNSNSAIKFTVYSASTTTSASIKIYYCTGESRSANLYVNGYLIQKISFPITGWYNFSYYQVNNVRLNSGNNIVEIRGGSTYWAPDFQKIVVYTP